MPSAASWERNSSSDSWHVAEIEYPGVYVEEVPLGVAPIAGVELVEFDAEGFPSASD